MAKNLGLKNDLVQNFIENDKDGLASNFGVPLSYTVKYLGNNQTMRVGIAGVFQDVITDSQRTVNSLQLCADNDGIEAGTAFSAEVVLLDGTSVKVRSTEGLSEHSCKSFDFPETTVADLVGRTMTYWLNDKPGGRGFGRSQDDAELQIMLFSPDRVQMFEIQNHHVKGEETHSEVINIR